MPIAPPLRSRRTWPAVFETTAPEMLQWEDKEGAVRHRRHTQRPPYEVGILLDIRPVEDAEHAKKMRSLTEGVFDRMIFVRDGNINVLGGFMDALKSFYKERMPDHIWVFGRWGKDILRICGDLTSCGIEPVTLLDYCTTGEPDPHYLEKNLTTPVYAGSLSPGCDLKKVLNNVVMK